MLEEELYEPMRMWLEQYMIDNYKGCNTIFALRVFDDTEKSFLENYIGKDYSDTLPTLEERHAIAIGKGIGLKQPVILQLNDMKYLQTYEGEEEIVEKNEYIDVETEEITPNL